MNDYRTRVVLTISTFAAVCGVTYFGLRSHPASTAMLREVVPTTTTTVSPTTIPPTTTTTIVTTTSTTRQALPDTTKPVTVPGGTFVIVGGQVKLTHVVAKGDTLSGIAAWYKLMGGYVALYKWNRSTIGNNPNLIFPGEVLTIRVPAVDIPEISPVYLAMK